MIFCSCFAAGVIGCGEDDKASSELSNDLLSSLSTGEAQDVCRQRVKPHFDRLEATLNDISNRMTLERICTFDGIELESALLERQPNLSPDPNSVTSCVGSRQSCIDSGSGEIKRNLVTSSLTSSARSSEIDCDTLTGFKSGCSATVSVFEACFRDWVDRYQTDFGGYVDDIELLTCDSVGEKEPEIDIEKLADISSIAACKTLQTSCL